MCGNADEVFGARVLILLTALLLAVTRVTEYLWHFGNFLHGGRDIEFGLLSIVTICCLVLVLCRMASSV
jgi:hypothetical protein